MSKYLLNNLDVNDFKLIITLIGYETQITDTIRTIKIPAYKNNRILIDTALNSGMNKYRFISTEFNTSGEIELKDYKYVNVSSEISKIANDILRNQTNYVRNSLLTTTQQNKLINCLL